MKFYSVREAADLLGYSGQFIRNLIQSGRLYAIRCGRTYRVPSDIVDRYLADIARNVNNPANKLVASCELGITTQSTPKKLTLGERYKPLAL